MGLVVDFIPAEENATPERLEPRAEAPHVAPDNDPWSTVN